jgi:hypothetical protein
MSDHARGESLQEEDDEDNEDNDEKRETQFAKRET